MDKLSSLMTAYDYPIMGCLGYDAPLAHNDSGFHLTMQNKLYTFSLTLIIAFSALTMEGCAFPGVFKINVQQGNIVTQDMLDKLKPGMTRKQVHFVLGNPVLKNTFSDSVENFVYTYQEQGGEIEEQKVKVFYENGVYARYEADLLDDHPAY